MLTRLQRVVAVALLLAVAGCRTEPRPRPPEPDYARALPAGQSALRLVADPARMPDLAAACRNADDSLRRAVDESVIWFAAPSSRSHFPQEGVTHERARASVLAMQELLESGLPPESLAVEIRRRFDVYESVGYDGRGTVLFTGYYAPVFPASRVRTERFAWPLYGRPDDLVTDATTGRPLGRALPDGTIGPYYTRREIETRGLLAGNELVWLEDPLSVYVVHVNGSARLRLVNAAPGEPQFMHVGYAGKTDRPYTGLGASLVEAGLVDDDDLSLAAIRRIYRQRPQRVRELMYRNESYVFFTEYEGDNWPAGSLGVRVTPKRTLATDKRIYPRGGLVVVDTEAVTFGGTTRPFLELMLDQDTGGAISAPGRADIFMGIGPEAEILAGGQYAEGRLYYLFLKPGQADPFAAAGE